MVSTARALRRRSEALKRARRRERYRDWHLPIPHALWERLRLVRALDGRSASEWARAVLAKAADEAILRKPGLAWARTYAPVYPRPQLGPEGPMVTAPLARTIGGERVLVIARLDGLDMPDEDGECERAGLGGVGYLCDLVPPEGEGTWLRRVVIRAVDVLLGNRLEEQHTEPSNLYET